MSTEPFTDELLSAIIDGEADADTIASVEADPVANARLAQMRRAVEVVATPVPEATPERRSASIAAAMAAATPTAPEVTSLAAARHQRTSAGSKQSESRGQWLILAAAAVALVVAIPLVLQFRSGSNAETAADTASSSDDTSFRVDDAADAAEDAGDESTDDAMEEGAMEEDDGGAAMAESPADEAVEEETADDAMSDDAEDSADFDAAEEPLTPADRVAVAPTAGNLEILEEFITFGSIAPTLTADQTIEAGVSPECLDVLVAEIEQIAGEPFVDEAVFDVAFIGDTPENERLVVVAFLADGTTMALDAEDCALLG